MKNLLILFFGLLAGVLSAQPSGDLEGAAKGSSGVRIYREGGRYGLARPSGRPLTPPVYDSLAATGRGTFAALRKPAGRREPRWGLIDGHGKSLTGFRFHSLHIRQGLVVAGVRHDNRLRYGVLDAGGRVLLPLQYNRVQVLGAGYFNVPQGNKQLIFNARGDKLATFTADSLGWLRAGWFKLYRQGKVGVAAAGKPEFIPPRYADVRWHGERWQVKPWPVWYVIKGYDSLRFEYEQVSPWQDRYLARLRHKSLLLDEAGLPLSATYDSLAPLAGRLLLCRQKGRFGVLNHRGEEVLPAIYDSLQADREVIYARQPGNRGKWLLFDHYGYPKTPIAYQQVLPLQDGLIAVQRHGKWGFVNRHGKEVISPVYDRVAPFRHDMARVRFYGEEGLIDRQGSWVMLPRPGSIVHYDRSQALIKTGAQYQVRNFDGTLVYFTGNRLEAAPGGYLEYDPAGIARWQVSRQGTLLPLPDPAGSVRNGGEGLVIFKDHQRYGFKDQQGRIIIANRYEAVRPFYNGRAAVRINHKWGFIDRYERLVVQPRYDSVGDFTGPYCLTIHNGHYGILSAEGKTIIANRYRQIRPLANGHFLVQKGNWWGVLDARGATIVPPRYDVLKPVLSQGYYIVARQGRYGTLSLEGIPLWPAIYSYLDYDEASGILLVGMPANGRWQSLHP